MIQRAVTFLLAVSLASAPALPAAPAQSPQDPAEFIQEAMKTVGDLKVGDTRAKLERDFRHDGGLEFSNQERYDYKKCLFIKIDVQFTHAQADTSHRLSPADTIVHVSKPYLEWPYND
jgi:hypothetical protein